MYHHSFLFVIVSSSRRIEEALQDVTPLDDCDYTFRTAADAETVPADARRIDTAWIYDSLGGAQLPKDTDEKEANILVAASGSSLLEDSTAVKQVSDIWVMPEAGTYDGALLEVYFQRLARRMKERANARKQGICFETLINSVPDISWFKDVDGAHLIVNDSFCELVGKSKEQIYGKGHCYIWDASKEDEEVCLNSDRIIMESRTTSTFEESVKGKKGTLLLKSYKSALIDDDGTVFGTCGIAHDVTALRNMSTELDMVLDNVPFAMLIENDQGIVVNKNAQFDKYFPKYKDIIGTPSKQWRRSLNRRLLLEERVKDVVVQIAENGEEQYLVFDEELIRDKQHQSIGTIITLTDITLERSIYRRSEHLANTDYLTGLNNRRNLMQYLENLSDIGHLTLAMIDLDNFKQVNDNYGHEAGDRALVLTADNLRECFSAEFIARLGGDEFLVVSCGKLPEEILQKAERLLEATRNAYQKRKEFSGMSASVGIVSTQAVPKGKRSIEELLQLADEMLYRAKKSGKNRCCVYGEKD